MAHSLANVKVSRDDSAWEIEVRGEIPAEILQRYREESLKEIQKDVKLDGFRPGKAPIERIIEVYGEAAVMKQAVEHAIQHELPELLASEKALIIESPRVSIEPPEKDKPVSFTARAALAPKVELSDYKSIAATQNAKKEEVSVSDEEHGQAMTHLRRERARIDKIETGTEPQKAAEEARAMKEEELPVLDDAFVRSLGMESAEKFSETVRANIKTEKEMQAREKRRASMLEQMVSSSKISYPKALLEYELDDMESRLKHDIERSGMTWEGYLKEAKKTPQEIRESWKDAADKRAKVRLILAEIARKENIEPEEKRLEEELERAKKQIPNADQAALRAHIAHALRNDATLRFLEGDTEPPAHHHHDH